MATRAENPAVREEGWQLDQLHNLFKEGMRMQPDRRQKRIEALSQLSQEGKRITDLSRLMGAPELWRRAYANIYANKGATTRGIDTVTQDGFSEERAKNLIGLIMERRYNPKPVRRAMIPKGQGQWRPLGIPSGDDKLVQEVVRMLLERIYEPVFSKDSHGFRPKKSVHTAMRDIQDFWTGTKWFVNIDVKGYFDHIDHDVLLWILEKKIDDKKFVSLITLFLKAGYVNNCWVYNKIHSGTPQGGIVSPILANIYLDELDQAMRSITQGYVKGKERNRTKEHRVVEGRLRYLRKRITLFREQGRTEEASCLLKEHQETRLRYAKI